MVSKTTLREAARIRRAELAADDFAQKLAAFAPALGIAPGTIVGGYMALPGEADPALLLDRLAADSAVIALPRVAEKDAPLTFHRHLPGGALQKSPFGIAEPPPDWPVVVPQILLVPLLAFDARGHRLGYGGGYYDRTIEALGRNGPLCTIGIAFAGQEIEAIPDEGHDRPLDRIATETGVRSFHHG
jgi:5-formyltetrahydrofolate cyclo-ligase